MGATTDSNCGAASTRIGSVVGGGGQLRRTTKDDTEVGSHGVFGSASGDSGGENGGTVSHLCKMSADCGVNHIELIDDFLLDGVGDVALFDCALLVVHVVVERDDGGSVGRSGGDGHAGDTKATLFGGSGDEGVLCNAEITALGPLLNEVADLGVALNHDIVSDFRVMNTDSMRERGDQALSQEDESLGRSREFAETIELSIELGNQLGGEILGFFGGSGGDVGTEELDARLDLELTEGAVSGNFGFVESSLDTSFVQFARTIVDETRHHDFTFVVVE